ncbi:MAG: hypothetical protein R6W78_10440 [Bacteroidales bacterium]
MANTTGKKFGGRQVGTPNKATTEIKELVLQFIQKNVNELQVHYDSLDAEKKLLFFERLLKFVLPTNQKTNLNIAALSDAELTRLCDELLSKMNDDEND